MNKLVLLHDGTFFEICFDNMKMIKLANDCFSMRLFLGDKLVTNYDMLSYKLKYKYTSNGFKYYDLVEGVSPF